MSIKFKKDDKTANIGCYYFDGLVGKLRPVKTGQGKMYQVVKKNWRGNEVGAGVNK